MANIKKIKLSNGKIYSIYDEGALRLSPENKLITGNSIVDKLILEGHLYIVEIDDQPITQDINNLLTAVYNEDTNQYEFKKRNINKVLEDIGGISANYDASLETLILKIGK